MAEGREGAQQPADSPVVTQPAFRVFVSLCLMAHVTPHRPHWHLEAIETYRPTVGWRWEAVPDQQLSAVGKASKQN